MGKGLLFLLKLPDHLVFLAHHLVLQFKNISELMFLHVIGIKEQEKNKAQHHDKAQAPAEQGNHGNILKGDH